MILTLPSRKVSSWAAGLALTTFLLASCGTDAEKPAGEKASESKAETGGKKEPKKADAPASKAKPE